jgi:hypothetical protein
LQKLKFARELVNFKENFLKYLFFTQKIGQIIKNPSKEKKNWKKKKRKKQEQ